jgi:hypothetical protein
LHELRSGYLVRATKEAAESLIAQLHSQGKVITPRHENRKIRHEIEILKANEHAPILPQFYVYRMTPKNIPQNLERLSL